MHSPVHPDAHASVGLPDGDVLEVLITLHGELRDAIAALGVVESTPGHIIVGDGRKTAHPAASLVDDSAARRVLGALLAHERLEADVLWPLLRREIPDGPELVGECGAEEKPLRLRLEALMNGADGTRVPVGDLRALAADFLAHMAHEERELTVRLPEALDAPRLRELGDLLRAHLVTPPDLPPSNPSAPEAVS